MLVPTLAPWAAPQTTGHPLGLPATTPLPSTSRKVAPVNQQSTSDTGLEQDKSTARLWFEAQGRPDPATHIAPPSITQLKIIALLSEQAGIDPTTGNTIAETDRDAALSSERSDPITPDAARDTTPTSDPTGTTNTPPQEPNSTGVAAHVAIAGQIMPPDSDDAVPPKNPASHHHLDIFA
ncbi:hypothetical protein [Puniceibacterium sp. IMCC21224]|uniref:hypothetical protein n=1 Tax=Puniceibacterium sp. IMCC21224 TaxID=1618204 RepID=UPI00064D7D5A|nr:hypothetical protein [Puniceibacterium sp. IMCC21224]KMK66505.1 hypothetical protein IMCC21224_111357 [Puniceibacterium sp. IMCC21224]